MLGYIESLLLQITLPRNISQSSSRHLDLGSGRNPRNPFGAQTLYALDHVDFSRYSTSETIFSQGDITERIPFEDNFFDSVSAFDVLEHVPRWVKNSNSKIVFPFIELMNEIHRVLKPGGIL